VISPIGPAHSGGSGGVLSKFLEFLSGIASTALGHLTGLILRYLLHFVVVACVAILVGILANAHLEISLRRPSATTSWREIVDIDVDLVRPMVYLAVHGDNSGGKTALARAMVSLRHFRLANRLTGTLERESGPGKWAVSGFRKELMTVLAHRGHTHGGEGVYILRHFSKEGIDSDILAGFAIFEDRKDANNIEIWMIKCPFLMIEREVAIKRYGNNTEAIVDDFPFMRSKCHEFKAVGSLIEIVQENGAIDDILAPKAER
jgi:hypothetical protein